MFKDYSLNIFFRYSHRGTRSFEREETMFRSSYTHESSLVSGTARSVSNEEQSNFYVRFVPEKKESNVPARSVEEFFNTKTVPVASYTDNSFPVDETLEDFKSVV